ncbi:MAG: type II toxin-antitoxin system death-on-curing family toxin [Oscillospiraceae bacterium]
MIKLTQQQITKIHTALIGAAGGSDGVREAGLLESALESPFQTFDGADIYPSVLQKAARLGFSLAANHPFVDGNKRIGVHAMLVFLALNGTAVEYTQNELIGVGLGLADGSMRYDDLYAWLCSHSSAGNPVGR